MYKIFCDGAYAPSRDQGGVGFVILNEDDEILAKCSKGYKNTSNQRMEQTAALLAINSIKVPSDIEVFTDSMYLVGTFTKNWKRKANQDLWKKLDYVISKHNSVKFTWVKGHAENINNNRCDILASKAIKSNKLFEDIGYII